MPDVWVRSKRGVSARLAGRLRGQRVREIQRVLHVPGGMLRRHVERLEVVVVVLRLRPLEDLEAEPCEDRLDLLPQRRQWMTVTQRRHRAPAATRPSGGGAAPWRPTPCPTPGQGLLDLLLELVGVAAHGPTLVRRKILELT